ncbi:MAG TPA: hypothetical protein VNA89_02520 [Gemmatimonadaceae bacterium]|nr:hypothetical protein [Gemmatimonadaceae bacterium]
MAALRRSLLVTTLTAALRTLAVAAAGALAVPAAASAQVVETPEPFDSAGRIVEITPSVAARLQLQPPAWRITGDYQGARLFTLGNEGYVIVVTRRSGVVERYSITGEDREYLRARTSSLPANLREQLEREAGRQAGNLGEGLRRAARTVNRQARNAFVRDQLILGLGVYGPSFALAISDNGAAQGAAYLLAAGTTFFGALEVTRQLDVTSAMHHLSTHGAVRGGGVGGLSAFALVDNETDADEDAIAAGVFIGSVAGTAAGLYFGQRMREGEAQAAGFGSDFVAAATLGAMLAADPSGEDKFLSREQAAAIAAAFLAGYPLGSVYARAAPYNVTAGDVYTLYIATALGVVAAVPFIIEGDPGDQTEALALIVGGAVGAVAGDRLLVRRLDHSRGDGWLVGLGAVAGGLMGAGLYTLANPDGDNDAIPWALMAAGGVAGIALAERYVEPDRDAGRTASRLRFNPAAVGLAAAGVRGAHPILSFTF